MKITIAKALKLKNRLVSKVNEVSSDIQEYNSVIEGQTRPVDINSLMMKREKLIDAVINLKSAISSANIPVQKTIYLLAELKGDVLFYKGIKTDSGKQIEPRTWGNEDKIYNRECTIHYDTIHGLLEQAQQDIDANQDALDKHNHTVEIEVDDNVMNLLRG